MLKDILKSCRLCPRQCGVDRTKGERGYCGAGLNLAISHIGPHFGEEPPISGTKGSGTIFLYHCTMKCVFCQNWQISSPPASGRPPESVPRPPQSVTRPPQSVTRPPRRVASISNCHNINLVSPTQYLPQVLEFIQNSDLPKLPIIYNTNGYESVEILKMLEGIIDIYLPDIKYADNALAKKYSDTGDYVENNQAALREMYRQVGLDNLIIRHLVLPGHLENSKKCLDFVAGLDKNITVSIMAQYSPQYQADRFPEINRKLSAAEYNEIVEYAAELGLENCFVQELASQENYLPDFTKEKPFT